ncbi:Pleckstrin like protein [Termitomyces sp. T112]|nr:Pleckstrin like protein [Termitomyces sp. T112]
MPPFLSTVRKSFVDVTINGGVNISQFLEASESIVNAFDRFELSALAVVKDDVKGNIEKVRAWYEDTSNQHAATLEELVKGESQKPRADRTATQGLLWLVRGLSFICKALQSSQANQGEELTTSFTKSYDQTLKKHHNRIVNTTFQICLKACPSRADFYQNLSVDRSDPKGSPPQLPTIIDEQLKEWLSGLEKIVVQLEEFYVQGGYDEGF